MRLRGKTILITGASAGIGRASAERFAAKGAEVIAVARNTERLDDLAQHKNITAITADLTDAEQRKRVVSEAGPIDVLVNNAGFGHYNTLEETELDTVREMVELNVVALIDLTQKFLPSLRESKGHVVNIGSIAGYVGIPPLTVYCATKFAVRGFSDALRRELFGSGVSVGLISPGPIKTGFNFRALTSNGVENPDEGTGGVPVGFVVRAIENNITRRQIPGYQAISVPRIVGLSRVADFPIINRLIDLTGPGLTNRVKGM